VRSIARRCSNSCQIVNLNRANSQKPDARGKGRVWEGLGEVNRPEREGRVWEGLGEVKRPEREGEGVGGVR